MKNKRGLSGVITSLLLILLTLVAVGVIWVVIANILNEGTDQIATDKFTVNMEVQSVSVNAGSVDVSIKRNVGKGDVKGVKVVLGDGENSESFDEMVEIDELEQKSINVPYDGIVKSVSIAPLLGGDGKIVGNSKSEELSDVDMLKSMGAVSWWRMEGNGNDEIGGNNGNLIGGIDCTVDGKSGDGCAFDGNDDYIDCGNDSSLNLTDAITIVAWIKKSTNGEGFIVSTNRNVAPSGGYSLQINAANSVKSSLFSLGGGTKIDSTGTTPIDSSWHHVAMSYSPLSFSVYLDGELENRNVNPGSVTYPYYSFIIGSLGLDPPTYFNFTGTIDEVILFKESLTDQQIKGLYDYNFS